MVTWEGRTYELTLSSVGENLIQPKPYRFHLEAVPEDEPEVYFYKIVPENDNPPGANPFKDCVLLPQEGRRLTKFVPSGQRLNPGSANYATKLQVLMDTIVEDKIEEDPCGYERLVGHIAAGSQPVNPVTFYKVEHTHQDDEKVLVIVRINLVGADPHGSIAVIG
jgi:hypothetical protein